MNAFSSQAYTYKCLDFAALQLVHSSKPVRHSYHNPTQYDQPDESVTWLKTFRTMNSHLLNDVRSLSHGGVD